MKNIITALTGLLVLSLAPAATADRGYRATRVDAPAYSRTTERYSRQASGEYDFAQVLDVQPIIRLVTVTVPRRECWNEDVHVEERRRRGSAGSTIAGGLIGGVIGRQIGGGSGRDAMTLVGALVGSAIGTESARANSRNTDGHVRTVQRCATTDEVREEERIDGYNVTYLYNGREYTTRTRNDPGERLRVRVSVNPAGRY